MATKTTFADWPTPPWTSTNALEVTEGNAYFPQVDVTITAIRWYRLDTTAGHAPTKLSLWDRTTGSLIYDAASIPDNGAVGWQSHTLSSPVIVNAGRAFIVSWHQAANNAFAQVNLSTFPGSWYPLSPQTGTLVWTIGATNALPGASGGASGFSDGLSLVMDFDPDVAPIGGGDIANELARWLSTADGTQADSAPLQDHATLATVNTNVADVKDQADDWAFGLGAAAHGYYADIKTLINNIKTITDTLPTPIAQLTSIVLDHYSDDIDNILAQIDSVLSGLGAQSTDLSGTSGSAVGALSGRTGFPATGWSMSAETDFTDNVLFDQPADAYVLSITSYQPTQPATSTAAGLWLPRLGWWCVMNGSLASQRQFVDFQQMLLTDQGRRMPACAIELKPGTIANVQAWLLA